MFDHYNRWSESPQDADECGFRNVLLTILGSLACHSLSCTPGGFERINNQGGTMKEDRVLNCGENIKDLLVLSTAFEQESITNRRYLQVWHVTCHCYIATSPLEEDIESPSLPLVPIRSLHKRRRKPTVSYNVCSSARNVRRRSS